MRAFNWIAGALLAAAFVRADDGVPPRSAGMQTLAPTEAHLDAGDIYYLEPGADHQLVLISDAPLLGLAITTRRMVGYIVCPFEGEPVDQPILGGAFRLPVMSLTGGGEDIDAGLRMPGLLNAQEHPEITFRITTVRDVESTAAPDQPPAYRLRLVGELTLNGQPLAAEWPVEVRHAPFVWQQMGRGIGDLVLLRFSQRIRLADAGLNIPQPLAGRLAGEVELRGYLTFTSVNPDKSLDPAITQTDNAHLLSFITRLRDFKDRTAAYARGRELEQLWWGSADRLNRLARAVLDEGGELRDLAFAQRVADRAVELAGDDPGILASQAEVVSRRGDPARALEIARRAAAKLAGRPPQEAAPVEALVRALEERVAAEAP